MTQRIDELVSVEAYFDHRKLLFTPKSIVWNNRTYTITKVGLHHEYKKGDLPKSTTNSSIDLGKTAEEYFSRRHLIFL